MAKKKKEVTEFFGLKLQPKRVERASMQVSLPFFVGEELVGSQVALLKARLKGKSPEEKKRIAKEASERIKGALEDLRKSKEVIKKLEEKGRKKRRKLRRIGV